jgi:hypothetical protein
MPRFQDRNASRVATIEAVQKRARLPARQYGGAIAKEFEKQGIKLPSLIPRARRCSGAAVR